MANYRRGRINDAVAQELAIALGDLREPKVINNFISIMRDHFGKNVVVSFFSFASRERQHRFFRCIINAH